MSVELSASELGEGGVMVPTKEHNSLEMIEVFK